MEVFYKLLNLLLVAAAYYYYNDRFMCCSSRLLGKRKSTLWFSVVTFLLNYGVFIVVTMLQFHLTVNWTIFLGLLLVELWLYFRCSPATACYLSLCCVMLGLAANIFARCGIALIMNLPLTFFDNQIKAAGNIKEYPVFFGFLLTGALFQVTAKRKIYEKQRLILLDVSSLHFIVILMAVMYGFLVLNLLSYYTDGGAGMKIWGIKSAGFVLVGVWLSNYYTYRMSHLNLYRSANQKARRELLEQKEEEERLKFLAYTDPLTGCYNRHYLIEEWDRFEQENGNYSLGFVDLDGLKEVNDSLGHPAGDRYLQTVVRLLRETVGERDILCRYGGDEFLLLYADCDRADGERRLMEAAGRLKTDASREGAFPMSFSYGVAENKERMAREELLKLADSRAYEKKEEKYKKRMAGD